MRILTDYFTELIQTRGVEAVAVYDNHRKVLDHWQLSSSEDDLFAEIGETFLQVFGMLEGQSEDPCQEIQLSFDKGIVYVYALQRLFVVVVARRAAEPMLVRLRAATSVKEMMLAKKYQRWYRKQPEHRLAYIKKTTLDDVEKIMLENLFGGEGGDRK